MTQKGWTKMAKCNMGFGRINKIYRGPNPEKVEAPKGGAPNVGGPKFRVFFSLSRHSFLFFFHSLLGFLVEFWWCLKRRDPQMCTFGVLGLSCASPGGPVWWGRWGFTRQPESPNVHI